MLLPFPAVIVLAVFCFSFFNICKQYIGKICQRKTWALKMILEMIKRANIHFQLAFD